MKLQSSVEHYENEKAELNRLFYIVDKKLIQ